jgi:hypothetical protein
MSLVSGAFPEYCRDLTAIPLTPELSGRKGFVAQVVAAELAFLGLVGRALDCSIVGVPGMVQGSGIVLAGGGGALAREIGILRDAARGKGDFGLGSGTRVLADKLGRAWVGRGYKVASDGRTLVSADGLRQYRPPTLKPSRGIEQANFERRLAPAGQWLGNGHLDITP